MFVPTFRKWPGQLLRKVTTRGTSCPDSKARLRTQKGNAAIFAGFRRHHTVQEKKKKKIFSLISWIVQKRIEWIGWISLYFPFYHLWASERSILYFFATSVSFRVGGPPSVVDALKLFFRDNATIQEEHFFALLPSKASSSGRRSHKSIFRHVKSSSGKQGKDPKQHIL